MILTIEMDKLYTFQSGLWTDKSILISSHGPTLCVIFSVLPLPAPFPEIVSLADKSDLLSNFLALHCRHICQTVGGRPEVVKPIGQHHVDREN